MKTSFIFIAALFSVTGALFAQVKPDTLANKTGVYITSDDYLKGKLTYLIDCKKPESDKIKIHSLSWNQTIDVVYMGKKRTLQKEDVYAYRDCDGATYRFYNNVDYVIAEAKGLYIYIEQIKSGAFESGYSVQTKHYFSNGPTGMVMELTLANLLNTFSDNERFCDLLKANFSHGENIGEYDFKLSTYKVNSLYELSKTSAATE